MNTPTPDWCELLTDQAPVRNGVPSALLASETPFPAAARPHPISREVLRHWAWVLGEEKAGDAFVPTDNHVDLGYVAPTHGFAHWRMHHDWIVRTERQRGDAWRDCVMTLRLYDVSFIDFNGFNAHSIMDVRIHSIAGHTFYHLPRPGTFRLAEVGFRLRSGEFIPAARSRMVQFPADSPLNRHSHAALYVDPQGRIEEVGNVWDQAGFLADRHKPRLRAGLRIATVALESPATANQGPVAEFVGRLAEGQASAGHDVHVFFPAGPELTEARRVGAVTYHPLHVGAGGTVLDRAQSLARAVERRLRDLAAFDLLHAHEWAAGLASLPGVPPPVLSVHSTEQERRNGVAADELSLQVERVEQEVARKAGCVLTPNGGRDRIANGLGVARDAVVDFPMEARLPNEWDGPLDFGAVKRDIGFGPLDRLILFVGPLEHAAGVDLLLESMPVMLQRAPNLRVAFAGAGSMHGRLEHRAREMRVDYAVRVLGHVERPVLVRLLRAAEALILPSRFRIPWDDAVVDLARLAGRPVVTTHAGPGYLIRHEQDGLVTYDNPGSMVWALDRLVLDPEHAAQMGRNGRRLEGASPVSWDQVARRYLDLCAERFPELRKSD